MKRAAFVAAVLCVGSGCAEKFEDPVAQTQTVPPSLRITAPSEAAGLPEGPATVTGTASGVQVVRVNGEEVPLSGTAFEGEVVLQRGINVLEVQAVEPDGDLLFDRLGVLAGDFAAPEGAVEEAVVARLNKAGLEELIVFGQGFIDPAAISKDMAAAGTIFSQEITFGTWVEASLAGLSFGTPDIDVTPTASGIIELQVVLPELVVDVDAWGEIAWFDFTEYLNVQATRAILTATLVLGAEDGQLTAELLEPDITLEGFAYDVGVLPSWVEDYLFTDTIRTTIEDQLTTQMTELVPQILDETLAGLDFSFETELLGTTLTAAAAFARVDVDQSGVEIGVDLDVSAPSAGTMSYNGYLATGAVSPAVNTTAEVAMAFSDDLLNRVLFELWLSGLLEQTLSTADGSLEPAMLSLLKAEEGEVRLRADLPPVIAQSASGQLQLQIAELEVTLLTPGGEYGERLVLDIAAFAELEPTLEDGKLALDLGELDLTLITRESDWGASNETITNLVEEMLPLETLLLLVGGLEFEIPSLGGLTIASAQVSRDGDGLHTGVTLDVQAE